MNLPLTFGALLGFSGIAFGAYAEHGLKHTLTAKSFAAVETGLRYQQLHAILITCIGLLLLTPLTDHLISRLTIGTTILLVGLAIFCGSIYLSSLTSLTGAVRLAPLGGITLMLGWLWLAWIGLTSTRGLTA